MRFKEKVIIKIRKDRYLGQLGESEVAEEEEVEQTHDMIKAIFNKIKIKKLKMQIIKLHWPILGVRMIKL